MTLIVHQLTRVIPNVKQLAKMCSESNMGEMAIISSLLILTAVYAVPHGFKHELGTDDSNTRRARVPA